MAKTIRFAVPSVKKSTKKNSTRRTKLDRVNKREFLNEVMYYKY